MYSSQQKNYTP